MSRSLYSHRFAIVFLLVILLLTQWACSFSTQATPEPTPTLAPTYTPVTPTLTKTPIPTPTNTPTFTPTPTPDRKATLGAKASATMDARMAQIVPKLEELGIDQKGGNLAWYGDKPITLSVTDYNSFVGDFIIDRPMADFVMHTGIVWDSSSGLAGCGINFRAEDDLTYGARYEFDMTRLMNAPAWGIYYVKFRRLQSNMGSDFNSYINDGNDSLNTVDLIAQSGSFTVYINNEKIKTVENNKLKEGKIFVMAHQESGATICTFKDGWVWELETKEE